MARTRCALIVVATLAVALAPAGAAPATGPLDPIEQVEIGPNREFRVNGEPFLPIMSWAQGSGSYGMLRSLGFNTFCGGGRSGEAAGAAKAAGGYLIPDFTRTLIGNPSVLAWIHGDEPDMPQRRQQAATPDQIEGQGGARPRGSEPKRPAAEVQEHYRNIKQADPSRPVLVTFTGHFFEKIRSHYTAEQQATLYRQYIQGADVVGFDIYPIYGHGRPGWLNHPADAVAQLTKMAGPRPVYAWIETSKGSRWMSYERQPDVLPMHTRFQVWGALINGATAIGYFTHAWAPTFKEFAPTDEMRAELLRINSQMTRLAPAILAAPARTAVTMTMSDGLPCQFKATTHDGSLYLFAQNRDLGPNSENLGQFDPISPRGGTATFTVAGMKAGTTIEVVDENRTLTAADGGFTDAFGPLAEHIYKIAQ
ncbi:MAG: hypothetical protein GX591_12200 [Planctomycetes bacterium]|nr:hypothetical protein [Planctomycetota bacterium]